jgi:rhodanese-related sulfurtransferase
VVTPTRIPVACPPVPASELADANIGREELQDKLARREPFKLVMAMGAFAFQAKHIPGSLHFDTSDQMFAALAPDDDIVVYCSNVECHASVSLYSALRARGYRRVRRYGGGLLDWEGAGLPLEGDWVSGS